MGTLRLVAAPRRVDAQPFDAQRHPRPRRARGVGCRAAISRRSGGSRGEGGYLTLFTSEPTQLTRYGVRPDARRALRTPAMGHRRNRRRAGRRRLGCRAPQQTIVWKRQEADEALRGRALPASAPAASFVTATTSSGATSGRARASLPYFLHFLPHTKRFRGFVTHPVRPLPLFD